LGALLWFSRIVDGLNERVGKTISWLILVSVLVSSGNATVRYVFDTSSNAWLELQWYLYSAVFLLCSGYTLWRNEHIRIDIVHTRLPARVRAWIDLLGGLFFLLPMALIILWLSIPMVEDSFVRHEVSADAGGLLRWPVKIIIPIAFALLALQGVSEIIKRIAFLMGLIADPGGKRGAHDPVAEVQTETP
jgi:TRAP-type mannitol/chloroaromatic compound transport system permease small subunit